ncbi:MAG: ice-binding family protein [Gammaproteobacteria bacterium]
MNRFENYSKRLTWCIPFLLAAFAAGCGGGRDPILGTGVTPDTTRPTVTFTVPAAGATSVATNTKVTATFSKDMNPATITATSFTLTGPGTTAVAGAVAYPGGVRTATFTPTSVLAANTLFTATITTGAKDLAGNALASNFVWTFTTGAVADTTPPTVTFVNPPDLATGVCLQKRVNATFSEAMDPATITTATFTLQLTGPPLGPLLSGTVAYDAQNKVATFTPTSALVASTKYTATITTGAKDLAGNALATNKVWTFTTGTQACSAPASPIALGTAAPFGNLGGTAGTTNTGLLTVIGGDLGSTATVTSAVTGFHDSAGDIYTETGSNKGTVSGKIYTCTVSTLGPTSAAVNATSCGIATQARSDAQTAFNNLAPASLPGGTDPGAGQLGGLTLFPGVYKAAAGSFQITGSDLTLDAQGDATAVWVFQTASTLTVGAPAAPRSIILINGALAKNVFWQVGTSATINGAGGGTMVGTILASSAVSFSTVGNVAIVTLNGRAVGLNASVTMTNTVINVPAP